MQSHALTAALALVLAGCLAGCGGGGGGNPIVRPDPPPAAIVDPVVYDPNPEFSKHLSLTGAGAAHAAGFTGEGIRIGVIDTGVNRNHPALSGRVVANLNYVDPDRNNLSIDDVVGHGTAVSQIMAGTAFGEWPGGIAPGAEIVSARIISDERPEDDGSGKGNEIHGAVGLAPVHQALINRGVQIMNNSWGGLYWTDPAATAPIAEEYRPFIIDHGGLVVFSTGNESFADPSSMAALPSQQGLNGSLPAADLERGWLAVAALDSDNPTRLAPYSNACGVAMNYCLAAPGDIVVTGTNDAPDSPTYWSWSGTSFSAPIVSGAAALVWEAYSYFDNDLVRQTLLGTATDLGAPGIDPVFGNGALDIANAIRGPERLVGDVRVTLIDGSSTWWNPIDSDGALSKVGAGTLVFDDVASFDGGLRVMGGALQSNAAITGNVTVGDQGRLLIGTGITGNLDNAGRIVVASADTGAEVVSLSLDGDYHHGADATFALQVGTMLDVSGTAQIDGGDVHVLGVRSGYTHEAREEFLQADGGLNGRFDELTAASGVFLDASLGYDADTAWLDITRLDVSAAAQAMGLSPAALSGAQRVEGAFRLIDSGRTGSGGFLGGAGALQGTPTAAAAERSLASLSGQLHQSGIALSLMAIDNNRHALETRFDKLPAGTGITGAWAANLDGERPASSSSYIQSYSAQFDSNGWVLGVDRRIGAHGLIGAAFSESRGRGWSLLRDDRERSRQVEGELYGAWSFGDSYLLGRFALGRTDRDLHRQIVLGSHSFGVESDYALQYRTASLQLGHRLHWRDSVLTPYVGVQAVRLQRDGFNETGAAGFGLSTNDSAMTSTQALLGVRFDRDFRLGGNAWDWHSRLEWQRQLKQTGSAIDARFTGLDAWAPIRAGMPGGDAGVFGFGVGTSLGGAGRLSLDIDGRHQDGQTWAGASANWSVAF